LFSGFVDLGPHTGDRMGKAGDHREESTTNIILVNTLLYYDFILFS